jgi:hypothetical protein
MKPSLMRSRAAEVENLRDGLTLAAESLAWFAAWVICPVWLAFRNTGFSHFLLYAIAVGCLLALGVIADRSSAFEDAGHFVWFAGITTFGILLSGGTMFLIAHLLFGALT